MKKAIQWLKDHAQLVGGILLAILGALAGGAIVREVRRTKDLAKRELKAIDAGKQAAQDAVEHGANFAVAKLESQHDDAVRMLSEGNAKKYDALKKDPRALAKQLSRLSS